MVNHGSGRVRLEFHVPTRGLIGLRSEFMTDTRGTAVLNSLLDGWIDWQGEIARAAHGRARGRPHRRHDGLRDLTTSQERGELFVARDVGLRGHDRRRERAPGGHGRERDQGQEADEHARVHRGRGRPPHPHRVLNLEQALEFINTDELVEVTPVAIRIRKRVLAANMRPKRKVEDATPA